MPSRTIKPIDSLFVIGASIIEVLGTKRMNLDDVYQLHQSHYPKKVDFEQFLLTINYLYTLGRVEYHDDVITIKFN